MDRSTSVVLNPLNYTELTLYAVAMDYCLKIGIFLVFVGYSVAIMNRDLMVIDVNDILSEKLMPLSFLYVQEPIKSDNVSIYSRNDNELFQSNSVADFESAFNLMQFHRKMIQNYQCNNYLAKQILTDIAPLTLHHRLGIATNSTGKRF